MGNQKENKKKKESKGSKGAKNKIGQKLLRGLKILVLSFFVSTILVVILYRFVPVYVTPLMFIRNVEQMQNGESLSLKKTWVPIEDISPNMVNAVVASEDNNFISHYGFDFEAIQKAQRLNKRGGKIYGASTISQQTAKNVFLWPHRSWVRKGFEVYFTALIEIFWSKERIMEVYLNVAEMGNGLYGVERASEIYYGKSAKSLTKSQAAMMTACLPSPRKYNPKNPTAYLYRRQSHILRVMRQSAPVVF